MIAFDLLCSQPVGTIQYHGGGEYTKFVFKYYVESFLNDDRMIVFFDTERFIDDWILDLIRKKDIQVIDVKNTKAIIDYLKNKDCEQTTFFAGLCYEYRKVIFPENIFAIGTCHGLRYVEKPFDECMKEYYSGLKLLKVYLKLLLKSYFIKKYNKIYAEAIQSFDYIITDSYHSAYSLKINYPEICKRKRIQVFYPLTEDYEIQSITNCGVDGNYILIISANRWIKNSFRAICAIDSLYSKGLLKNHKTRVYGGLPNRIKKRIVNKDCFIFYDYVSTAELEEAYQNCSILFYPSLNEGFGNVPMEAMKYGKTCVVSAVCSLVEVYSNSVYYCNPYDLMEMENRILLGIERRVDYKAIEERLTFLHHRQKEDLVELCRIIKGELK